MSAIVTPEFRVSFPKLFVPELNKLSNKSEYSVVAVFKKGEDLSKLYAAAKEAIEKKWPNIATRPKNLKSPFRDQADRAKETEGKMILPQGYEEGAIFMNLKSKNKPGVVDEQVQAVLDESTFYAGCYARAAVSCYAYDQAGNRGVAFGLTNIQKVRDGEPFSGRPTAESSFAPIPQTQTTGKAVASAADIFG